MSCKIPDFYTEHFHVPGKQIEEWNQGKIALPEGAGVKYIAPTNLVAILRKPFYYDWEYETDGKVVDKPSYLVYDELRVDKKIHHFSHCKELLEINRWLKENGWNIPVSWVPIVNSLLLQAINKHGSFVARINYAKIEESVLYALLYHLNLNKSGVVQGGDLNGVSSNGNYWSASEFSANVAHCLYFHETFVNPQSRSNRIHAHSVRCVSME